MNDWMGKLPDEIRRKSLSQICIPGSHDSGAQDLNVKGPVAHDQNFWKKLEKVAKIRGAKTIIRNWSETQSLTVTQQLNIGIRYFDIRMELVQNNPSSSSTYDNLSTGVYFVHGLYGRCVMSIMEDIKEFLEYHKSEVVIVDINHIYRLNPSDFITHFALPVQELFGADAFLPTTIDPSGVSLDTLVNANKRLIIIGPYDAHIQGIIHAKAAINSTWPQKNRIEGLIDFMRTLISKPRQSDNLFVLQGVLTASIQDVARNIFHSLRTKFTVPSRRATIEFIKSLDEEQRKAINIVITDEVNELFTMAVVDLNTPY